jgi:hypothetical protein
MNMNLKKTATVCYLHFFTCNSSTDAKPAKEPGINIQYLDQLKAMIFFLCKWNMVKHNRNSGDRTRWGSFDELRQEPMRMLGYKEAVNNPKYKSNTDQGRRSTCTSLF